MIRARAASWGPYLAALAVALSFTLLLLSGLYTFTQQRSVNRKLCLQTVENREGQRLTWNAARDLILSTSQNADGINKFFDAILETIPPLECIDNKPVVKEEQ